MFSIDINNESLRSKRIKGLHLYVENINERRAGFSYLVDETGIKLENHYSFYNAKGEVSKVIHKLKNSVFAGIPKTNLCSILLPELVDCKNICVANKPKSDCIYFSGINISQFLFFLRRFEYPPQVIKFVDANKGLLDHLKYDVGFDFRLEGSEIKITKSGYYGFF